MNIVSRIFSFVFLLGLLLMPSSAFALVASGTINVTTTTDEMATPGTGCSLREAITSTNTGTNTGGCTLASGAYGSVMVIKVPDGTYTLTIAGTGEDVNATGDLDITLNGTTFIDGASRTGTIIQAGTIGTEGTPNGIDRVFHAINNLRLSNLTVRNGNVTGNGGGIYNSKFSILQNVSIANNTASVSGGGIYTLNTSLTLRIYSSQITGNKAPKGGGIDAWQEVLVHSSLFANNQATAGPGGGMYFSSNIIDVYNSTFHDNSATTFGGAVSIGGGGAARIFSDSIIANSANKGGGIGDDGMGAVNIRLENTVVFGNSATTSGPDLFGPMRDQGYNYFGNTTGATDSLPNNPAGGAWTATTVSSTAVLAALADNGGPFKTYAPLAGSVLIDGGNPTGHGCKDLVSLAPLVVDGSGSVRKQNTQCDIGAVESTGTGNFDISVTPQIGTISAISYPADTAGTQTGKPTGAFDYGLVGFTLNVNTGATVSVDVTFPDLMPTNSAYYKQTAAGYASFAGAVFKGKTVTLTLTDGGAGDSDGVANGTIVDPGGPISGAKAATSITLASTDSGTVSSLSYPSDAAGTQTGKPTDGFPHGLIGFTITGVATGGTAVVTLTLPAAMAADSRYFKQTAAGFAEFAGAVFDGTTKVVLTLVDGGAGDSDGVANGTIVDPGGPAAAAVVVADVITFGNGGGGKAACSAGTGYALAPLFIMLMLVQIVRVRRQRQRA